METQKKDIKEAENVNLKGQVPKVIRDAQSASEMQSEKQLRCLNQGDMHNTPFPL